MTMMCVIMFMMVVMVINMKKLRKYEDKGEANHVDVGENLRLF